MRSFIVILLLGAMLLGCTCALYASTPGEKLTRGVANVLSGLIEVPLTIGEEWKASNNALVGIVAGTFKGLAWAVCRTGSGIYDILTFPIAVPENYQPLFKPDYVWRTETSDFATTKATGSMGANETIEKAKAQEAAPAKKVK